MRPSARKKTSTRGPTPSQPRAASRTRRPGERLGSGRRSCGAARDLESLRAQAACQSPVAGHPFFYGLSDPLLGHQFGWKLSEDCKTLRPPEEKTKNSAGDLQPFHVWAPTPGASGSLAPAQRSRYPRLSQGLRTNSHQKGPLCHIAKRRATSNHHLILRTARGSTQMPVKNRDKGRPFAALFRGLGTDLLP